MTSDAANPTRAEIAHLQRVREIFDRVVDEPEGSWSALVAAVTGADPALRDEVLQFLAIYRDNIARWEQPRLRIGDGFESEDRAGQLVGRYRLIRLLGQGGMGMVYEGRRADDAYDQRVAVKLVAAHLVAAAMGAHFRHERQILAALEHRNIARLLDGGATDQGEPFFVMEYVEGRPITVYCDESRLSIADRLRLFLQVCAAVQYAHGKLVVHRDLKPANMLVAADGSVKLLDFGIAKLLGADETGGGMSMPPGPRLVTPEYASPEQLREEPVSTASDVYSLGVVLYELLAGRRPVQVASRSPHAMLQAMNGDLPRPSAVATDATAAPRHERDARRLRRRLVGELDSIVGKSLRREPAQRYQFVEQMAEDIRRHLDGRPVLAQPGSAGYRLRKHVHRHWVSVLAASVAVIALVVGSTAAVRQARRAERERAKAAHVNAFLQEMLATLDSRRVIGGRPAPSSTTIAGMLDGAASRAGVELALDPAVESAVRHTLGDVYIGIGRYDRGVEQLTRAVAIDRRLGVAAVPGIAGDLAALGDAQLERGDNHAADTLFRAELALCGHDDGASDSAHVCVVALNDLAGADWFENRLAESERLYREAWRQFRQVFGTDNALTGIVLGNLGGVLDSRGDLAGADSMYRISLDIYARIGGRDLPQRAFTLGNLADNLAQRGRYAEADSLVREEIAVIGRSEGADHPDAGLAWVQVGAIDREVGDIPLARTETTRGQDILGQSRGIARRLFVKAGVREALLQLAEKQPEEARVTLHAVLDSATVEFTPDDPRYAEVQAALGATFTALHQRADAVAAFTQSYRTYLATFGPTHPATVAVQGQLQAAQQRSTR